MIALSSPALSLMPLRQALDTVSTNFQAWEVVGEGRHYLPDIERELKGLMPSYSLQFSVHGPLSDINIGSLNPRLRQAALDDVLRSIECAGRLGLNPFTVHPGFYTPQGSMDKAGAIQSTKESLKAIDQAGKEHGVVLALENMPHMPISMVTTPQALLDMLEGTELRICLDLGHANTTGNIDGYLELMDRVANMHVHDNNGKWDQHLTIGEGNIDFHRILSKVKGYKGRFVIEARDIIGAPISQERLRSILAKL